jgi:hypothetical protein
MCSLHDCRGVEGEVKMNEKDKERIEENRKMCLNWYEEGFRNGEQKAREEELKFLDGIEDTLHFFLEGYNEDACEDAFKEIKKRIKELSKLQEKKE